MHNKPICIILFGLLLLTIIFVPIPLIVIKTSAQSSDQDDEQTKKDNSKADNNAKLPDDIPSQDNKANPPDDIPSQDDNAKLPDDMPQPPDDIPSQDNKANPPDDIPQPQSSSSQPPDDTPSPDDQYKNHHHSKNKHSTHDDSNSQEGSAQSASPNPISQPTTTPQKKGCLIATAAFGSELSPQVQFLRNFRDHYIMSTIAGSNFMNVFNAWYYSFSPYVADYESGHSWLQQIVKSSIYPLLGILTLSEKAYHIGNGEVGAICAGIVASSLIGSIYLSPFALLIKKIRKNDRLSKKFILLMSIIIVFTAITSLITKNNLILMLSTSVLVLTTTIASSIIVANRIATFTRFIKKSVINHYH
ncbi:MAG TPA: CFI-box-CTERM domain-containing protein [Candidatus Sulfopaludibacter sp.]|nr:CFI-box-CTERM domain-containing protein [Candidatus Sulfopaludibacter sp.]